MTPTTLQLIPRLGERPLPQVFQVHEVGRLLATRQSVRYLRVSLTGVDMNSLRRKPVADNARPSSLEPLADNRSERGSFTPAGSSGWSINLRSSADLFSRAAFFLPRRDDPHWLLGANIQAINCFRNSARVGIGHHVSGIIHKVQVGSAQHPV